jgi:nucleoside-diphosphate-sugar epimerase
LITGGGGFIGLHLGNRLAAGGNQVIGLDLHFPRGGGGYLHENFRPVRADFRNRGLMEEIIGGVNTVFHLAGAHLQISLPASEYWSVNVHSLGPLLDLADRAGVRRFVHVSSVGVYGNLAAWPADEETPCNPASIYGETKLAGEVEVRKYCEKTGFQAVIVRPAWVYGPGCPRTLKLYNTLRKRRFVMVGAGRNLRHPVYIKDMVDALILAARSGSAAGQTIVIGGERAVTTEELVGSFCSVLGLPKPKIKLPMKLGEVIATGLETVFTLTGKEPPFSRRSLEFFSTNNSFDISKAKKFLGFHPSFTLEEGLKETREWLEKAQR